MVSLSLLEFKQLLLILCNTQHFGQLAVEEFNLVADHNRCVNRFRFESIIKVISKFFSYLEENTFFRSHSIGGMIKECFEQVDHFFLCIWKTNKPFFYNRVIKMTIPCSLFRNILVPWHDWFDGMSICWPLAETKYWIFPLLECFGAGLSHQRITKHCARSGVCKLWAITDCWYPV